MTRARSWRRTLPSRAQAGPASRPHGHRDRRRRCRRSAQGPGVPTLERIMGRNDLMSVAISNLDCGSPGPWAGFTSAGPTAPQGYGTGFLVSPRLVLTNNHVLTDAAVAGASRVEFDFQEGIDGKLQSSIFVDFDPAAFFVPTRRWISAWSPSRATSARSLPTAGTGCPQPRARSSSASTSASSSIRAASESNSRCGRTRSSTCSTTSPLRTDTSPGSSGSPVFNDQWEIVALHHSGVPKKDAQGRILARDGGLHPEHGREPDRLGRQRGRAHQRDSQAPAGAHLSGPGHAAQAAADSEKGWQAGTAAPKELAMKEAEAADSAPASAVEWLVGSTGSSNKVAMNGLEAEAAGSAPASAAEWLLGRTNGSRTRGL